MAKLEYFLCLFVILVYESCSKVVPAGCPSFCECDMYQNYRRAVCRKDNWVTIEANIPTEVQILDMSKNQIGHLGDHIFEELGLSSLKILNLSTNAINVIHMNAFLGLTDIKTIDLSYNRLRSIVVNWFWDLDHLQELYLNNNYLGAIGEEPLLENKALKVLVLSNCFIPAFHHETFSKLPSLEVLDISGNPLLQLHVSVIKWLSNLNVLLTDNIKFDCNENMKNLSHYCREVGIRYDDYCLIKGNGTEEKFQKMRKNEPEKIPKNAWIFDDNYNFNKTSEGPVPCLNTTRNDFLEEITKMVPVLSTLIAFFIGVIFGICMATLICSCKKGLPNLTTKRKKIQKSDSDIEMKSTISNRTNRRYKQLKNLHIKKDKSFEDQSGLLDNSATNSNSTPMTPRKILNG